MRQPWVQEVLQSEQTSSLALALIDRLEGQGEIYVADVESGGTRILSPDPADDALPTWSPDGRFVYFSSRRGGDYAVWRAPLDGGAASQVSDASAGRARVSPDNRFVYFGRSDDSRIYRRALTEEGPIGPEEQVGDIPYGTIHVTVEGIYWRESGVLRFRNHSTGTVSDLVETDGSVTSISPDETTALVNKSVGRGIDLMLLRSELPD